MLAGMDWELSESPSCVWRHTWAMLAPSFRESSHSSLLFPGPYHLLLPSPSQATQQPDWWDRKRVWRTDWEVYFIQGHTSSLSPMSTFRVTPDLQSVTLGSWDQHAPQILFSGRSFQPPQKVWLLRKQLNHYFIPIQHNFPVAHEVPYGRLPPLSLPDWHTRSER